MLMHQKLRSMTYCLLHRIGILALSTLAWELDTWMGWDGVVGWKVVNTKLDGSGRIEAL
jgi:hypothetical protein